MRISRIKTRILLGILMVAMVRVITYISDKRLCFLARTKNRETENTTFIIIVTYYRSGSTLLAEIIQQSKQVFYIFEPFTEVSPNGIYETDNVCDIMNGHCRKPTHLFEQLSFVLEQLQHFFKCNLDMLEKTFMTQYAESNAVLQLKTCRQRHHNFHCLQKAVKDCEDKPRLVKTIRLSLRALKQMISCTPSMKIVYLVRDPRGIINSRLRSPLLGNNNLTNLAHALCARYDDDFRVFDSLTKNIPKRIKLVSYENIISEPFILTKGLYQFLNLSFNQNISIWLKSAMFSGKKSSFYEVYRPNATATAYRWMTSLSKENITYIDNICGHLYTRLNVKRVNS